MTIYMDEEIKLVPWRQTSESRYQPTKLDTSENVHDVLRGSWWNGDCCNAEVFGKYSQETRNDLHKSWEWMWKRTL